MKKIKKLAEAIKEEVYSAEEYAEKYIEHMADGDDEYARWYREMAEDEIKHADYLHQIATDVIQKTSRVFNPPMEMREKWDKTHDEYITKMSQVKSMLNVV